MKNALINDIEITFDRLLSELAFFSNETLNKTPPFKGWTAGQTVEHIIICGSGIPDSSVTQTNRPYDEKIKILKGIFLDFNAKYEADPSLQPISEQYKKEELIQTLLEIKQHLMGKAETDNLELLCQDMEFPSLGYLTRHEWLRFIVFHTERHIHQISNIRKSLSIT
ncbi:DinB family protein [Bizionia paragorgiae]|uniref:DinB family protein n=1 Tax=Bizionia paragorgiae TaxID=283786 RepID=UPI003A8DFF4D